MDDRAIERLIPELAGRPLVTKGKKQIFFPGMKRISEASVLTMKNRSFQVTAQIVVLASGAQGTMVAQGGKIGGWGLLMEKGAAKFAYNLFGVKLFIIDANRPLTPGKHQVRAEFAYDGGGLAKGGTVTLYYDGEKVGDGRVEVTEPMIFYATECLDVGRQLDTTVLDKSPKVTFFNGEIIWVELSVVEDDHSHLIKPDDHMTMLMSKQ